MSRCAQQFFAESDWVGAHFPAAAHGAVCYPIAMMALIWHQRSPAEWRWHSTTVLPSPAEPGYGQEVWRGRPWGSWPNPTGAYSILHTLHSAIKAGGREKEGLSL